VSEYNLTSCTTGNDNQTRKIKKMYSNCDPRKERASKMHENLKHKSPGRKTPGESAHKCVCLTVYNVLHNTAVQQLWQQWFKPVWQKEVFCQFLPVQTLMLIFNAFSYKTSTKQFNSYFMSQVHSYSVTELQWCYEWQILLLKCYGFERGWSQGMADVR